MIDEVFRKNKTTQKIADAEERFLKISPMPDGSKVVDTRSSRLTYVADPVDDKDAINKSWATKYFKDEKDAITKLGESATAKSAEIDTKLVKFNADKASIEQTGEELKVLGVETKTRAEETKAKLESALAQLEQAKTKIDTFNADYAKAKELKGDVEGKSNEVMANLENVRAVLNDVTTKSTDILLTYTNAKQDLTNLSNATKREIATTKASIDTRANEALNQASTSLAGIKAIVADFKGKQTELNTLKASLETLKSSLENLNKSGLINDTEAGVAQTYSSNKINSLLQGVLRESDTKYLTETKGDERYLKTLDVNQPNGYPQLDTNSKISVAQLPTEINATTLNGQSPAYYASYISVKNTEQSLRSLIEQTQEVVANKLDTSEVMEGNTAKIKTSTLPDTLVYLTPSRTIPVSALPLREPITMVTGNTIDLTKNQSKHFVMQFTTKAPFKMWLSADCAGQTGVIIVKTAKNITSWDGLIKWSEIPINLKDTEVFAYFVVSNSEVYMGRA